jgi:hypothetical protein
MSFDEWFEENRERLERMLRSDTEELVYECWLAGYKAGLDEMGSFAAELFSDTR